MWKRGLVSGLNIAPNWNVKFIGIIEWALNAAIE